MSVKHALGGAAIVAIALPIAGFTLGGWVKGSTAMMMANSAACAVRAEMDPDPESLTKFYTTSGTWTRTRHVRDAHWARHDPKKAARKGADEACAEDLWKKKP